MTTGRWSLRLASTAALAAVLAGPASYARHPAQPGAEVRLIPYDSPFATAVPLLDRGAPLPSFGPPSDRAELLAPAPDHGAMGHGAPQQRPPQPAGPESRR